MQTIIVDITPGYRMPTIYYSQNDVGTQFAIDLRSRFGDSLPASPTVTIQATKPSGFGFSVAADSITNGVATFTTTDEMTDESGRFPAELKVEASGVTLFTANFYMEGEANTHPAGTIDGQQETVIPELTQLVERVETAASSVLDMTVEAETLAAGSQATYSYDEDTNTATFGIPQGEAGAGAAGVTASAYSSSKTYAVGDYVIHNSNLYRCTTAITTAEAFTAAHWTQVVLADDVSDVKRDLTYNGDKYFPTKNLLTRKHMDFSPYPNRVEKIADDDCNIAHFTNNGSSAQLYFDVDEGFLANEKMYVSMLLKGSVANLDFKLSGLKGSSTSSIKTFKTQPTWTLVNEEITVPADADSLRFTLVNVGEVWMTNLVISKSPIDYDYSIKSKLERLEPLIDTLDGNIVVDQFSEDLRSLFAYAYESVDITWNTGYMQTDGTLSDYSGGRYDAISVLQGERYRITSNHGSALRMYVLLDSNNNVVEYYPSGSITTVTDTKVITIPVNGTLYVNTYDRNVSHVEKANGLTISSSSGGIGGKTWFALGDSITEYAHGYHSIIASQTGVDVTNGGVSGSGYMKPINNQTFVDRANLSSVYDIVTVFGSVNDMQYVADYLGTESDTGTATLGGCFNTLIDNLYASGNYHIGIIAPIPQGTTNGNPANTTGTFAKYTELLEKVCRRRGVPYLDLWHCSNMQPWDSDFAEDYMQDNTHPNTNGHAIFAPRIKAFIQSL